MRSRAPSYAITIVLPLSAALVLPSVRWCSLTWSQLSTACVIRCAVASPVVCPPPGCAEHAACRTGCPMAAASDHCPAADTPSPAPARDDRAFCFRDTPAVPGVRLASPPAPRATAVLAAAPITVDAPQPIAARTSLEPSARPPTALWRTSPPVRGPPETETT